MEALYKVNCAYCGTWTTNNAYCCNACEVLDGKFAYPPESEASEFSYLDQENFKSRYKLQNGNFDYVLYVEGLQCASCIHLLEKIPDFDLSVVEARVDYSQSRLALRVSSDFSLANISALLKSWGYGPHFLENNESSMSLQEDENKKLLKKLAVTGACAGNIMLFVIPVYSGLDGSWKTAFNWMSFFIFLPILLYSGTSFYKGAWNSLRYKTINVDLPITVALLSGFIMSTYNLVLGLDAIYFDSTAGFLFLILASRYYLKISQQKFQKSTLIQDLIKSGRFTKIWGSQEKIITLGEIKKGDVIKLIAGDIVPVDGFLLGSALFDVAVLNGEPLPRKFDSKMFIQAGSRLLSKTAKVVVSIDPQKSHLALLLKELQDGSWKKTEFVGLTDKLSQWLILTVFSLAIVFFVFYFRVDTQEAFNRSLALIVLACPCALAFGTPLAFNMALLSAQKKGILIKSSSVFEKIPKIKNIFFDKTGTLTEIDLHLLSSYPNAINFKLKSVIISLEQQSYHPIAFSLRKAWSDITPISVENLEEHLGKGVSGKIFGNFYELFQCENSNDESKIRIELRENGVAMCRLTFESRLLSDCPALIAQIKNIGKTCFLLSGDSNASAKKIGELCKIDLENSWGSLSGSQKRDFVQGFKDTCMIGDGTNDSLALQTADVGIAVKGSTYASLKAADIYFTRSGLSPLLDLFELAHKTKIVLIRNISFSLAYNVIGGALALSGFVNPWVAAILMPISSVLIIASTLWGFR